MNARELWQAAMGSRTLDLIVRAEGLADGAHGAPGSTARAMAVPSGWFGRLVPPRDTFADTARDLDVRGQPSHARHDELSSGGRRGLCAARDLALKPQRENDASRGAC